MAAAYLTCIILGVEEVHAAPKKRPAGTGPPPPATPPPVAAAAAPRQHTDRDGTPLQEVQTVPAYSGGIPMRGFVPQSYNGDQSSNVTHVEGDTSPSSDGAMPSGHAPAPPPEWQEMFARQQQQLQEMTERLAAHEGSDGF